MNFALIATPAEAARMALLTGPWWGEPGRESIEDLLGRDMPAEDGGALLAEFLARGKASLATLDSPPTLTAERGGNGRINYLLSL